MDALSKTLAKVQHKKQRDRTAGRRPQRAHLEAGRLENQSIGTRVEAVNRGLKDSLRPNDWSNWASFWQGVQIWYPCENVLGEIAFRLVELQ